LIASAFFIPLQQRVAKARIEPFPHILLPFTHSQRITVVPVFNV